MPSINIDAQEAAEYERLIQELDTTDDTVGEIRYDCPYPKHRFIAYVAEHKAMIIHGSNNNYITRFETRRQTLFNGKYVEAVFGTKDAIWPIFYAVFNRSALVGNFRNGCIRVKNDHKQYYFFSLTEQTMNNNASPWTSGTIYFLPQQTFTRVSNSAVYFDEWISKDEVSPQYKLAVTTLDFPLANHVSIHRSEESILKTLIFYKRRLKPKFPVS